MLRNQLRNLEELCRNREKEHSQGMIEDAHEFNQLCIMDQKEQISQLTYQLQDKSALILNLERKLLLLAEQQQQQCDEGMNGGRSQSEVAIMQRVEELSSQLSAAQDQLSAERRSHEAAVSQHVSHITEFEALLVDTRVEFQTRVTEALQSRDEIAIHCDSLRETLQEQLNKEQANRVVDHERLLASEREVATLKAELFGRGDRSLFHIFTL